jgi:hypothetical protein
LPITSSTSATPWRGSACITPNIRFAPRFRWQIRKARLRSLGSVNDQARGQSENAILRRKVARTSTICNAVRSPCNAPADAASAELCARRAAPCPYPSSAASLRQDQCVDPSFGLRLVASNTLACSAGVITEGFCPGCRISIKPSTRCCRNRSFQRAMVGAVVASRSWMVRYGKPSASRRIRRARNASPAGSVRDCVICSNSIRSSVVNEIASAVNGISHETPPNANCFLATCH